MSDERATPHPAYPQADEADGDVVPEDEGNGGDDRDELPGGSATKPSDIPREGWKQILVRTKEEIKADRVGLMAGGVAYYAMLAIFPTLIAAITLWGLVSDPQEIQRTVDGFAHALPSGAADLITSQVTRLADTAETTLGWTLAVSLLGALWSASTGTKGLMNAVNAAYDEEETRGFLRLRGTALLLTFGGILLTLVMIGLIAVVPAVLGLVGLGEVGTTIVRWGRWPLLVVALLLALSVVYRYAPDRDDPRWRWLSWGSVAALVVWLAASVGFALYVQNFGSFGETYGSIAGVIVLMLWLFLTAFAILLGAEINAEMEHQTRRDTTKGEPQPMGERGAFVADTTPRVTGRG